MKDKEWDIELTAISLKKFWLSLRNCDIIQIIFTIKIYMVIIFISFLTPSFFHSWDKLKDDAEERKKELVACLFIQNLYCEMTETQTWMVEKSRLLASVEDPGVDLSSVITLQRRLNTIERDIAALPSKVSLFLSKVSKLSNNTVV